MSFSTIKNHALRIHGLCSRRGFPFMPWPAFISLVGLWALATAWLIYRFNYLGTDSVLYGLPLADSKGPLSLSIPMLGDFPSYSGIWGHHWPGAMWVRGLFYSLFPFERLTDITLLVIAQYCTGVCIGLLAWRSCRSVFASVCATIIVCMDRSALSTVVDHRFECISILSTVILYISSCFTTHRNPSKKWLAAGSLAALMAGWSHPFSMLLAGGVIFLVAMDWLIWRDRAFRSVLIPATSYLMGICAAAGYYLAVPEAREQFLNNLALQSSFSSGDRLIFFTYLQRISFAAVLLWAGGLAASFWLAYNSKTAVDGFQRYVRLSLAAMIWAVPALFVMTATGHIVYLSFGTPFTSAGLAIALGSLLSRDRLAYRTIAYLGLAIPTFAFLAYYSFRWLVFFQSGRPDFPTELREIYGLVPAGHRVYLPPVIWDAARKDTTRETRLWTLSVAAPREIRLAYEEYAFNDIKADDYLIIDRLSFAHRDEWGVLPTYEIHPPDPEVWEHVQDCRRSIAGHSGSTGYDLGIYRFKGIKWDPSLTPRKLEGR